LILLAEICPWLSLTFEGKAMEATLYSGAPLVASQFANKQSPML
jgi:hypothetical protein